MSIVNLVQSSGAVQNTPKTAAVSNSTASFNTCLAQAINRTTIAASDIKTAAKNPSPPHIFLASTKNLNTTDETAVIDKTNQGIIKESDWLALKPDEYTTEQFKAKIADANTRLSYLNPDQLPNYVTKPEEGISRSTDMVRPPTFEETTGGVNRIDHTRSGSVLTFIPSFEWRKTTTDSVVGTAYNQQTPWGFRTLFIRDGSGRTPDGYHDGDYAADINRYVSGNQADYVAASEKANSGSGMQSYKGEAHKRAAFLDTNEALLRLQYASDIFMKQQQEEKAEDLKRSMA